MIKLGLIVLRFKLQHFRRQCENTVLTTLNRSGGGVHDRTCLLTCMPNMSICVAMSGKRRTL